MPYYIRKSPNYVPGQKFTAVKMRLIKKVVGIGDVYTKLLLHFDDDISAMTFSDVGQSSLTQTKFGTVTTSTTQSKFGGKSLALNGVNTNKLQFSNPKSGLQSTFNFGSQDFTIEGWFYITALTNQYQSLIEFYDPTMGGAAGPVLLINPSNRIAFHEDANGYILATSITPVLNQWYHIAVLRKNNVITIYVNGARAASSAFTATLRTSYAQCNIGNFPHVGGGYTSLNGYVDNVRVQLGEAVYSAGFTPQSAQFNDGKNLLLHFDGANGSTSIVDSSVSTKTLTAYGNAVISSSKSKFGGTSLYLDGTNTTYVKSNNSADYSLGTGDFTIEFWMNTISNGPGYSGYHNAILDTRVNGNNGLWLGFNSSSKIIAWYNGSVFLTSNATIQPGVWYNIALVRKNTGLIELYINGELDSYIANASGSFDQNGLTIGSDYVASAGISFNGYIDELRICKGQALYNSDITPPVSAVTSNSYTKLLMNFDGANGSTSFVESSSGLTVNVQGNVTISTEQSKFGGSSLKMTGGNGSNGLKIDNRVTSNQPIYLNDNDWTMEGWFWFNQKNVGYQPLFSFANDDGNYPGPQIYIESNNILWYGHQNQAYSINSGFNPDANRWYHIAVSKSNTSIKLFVDGTQVGSTLTTPKTITTPNYVFLGVFAHAKNLTHFNGYIDGVRIQVGESLYNSNFTPSAAAPVANAYTKLLMNFEDALNLNAIPNGLSPQLIGSGITVSSDRFKFGSKSLKMTGGTTDYLRTYNNSQPIALLDRAFTIEGWFWLNTNSVGYQPLIMMASTGDFQGPIITMESNNTLTALLSNGSSWAYSITSPFTPTANAWHHVALVREYKSGPIKFYCDGQLIGSNNTSDSIFTSDYIWLGHYPYYPGGARTLNGYIDEVRIALDYCAYVGNNGNFTPSSSAFTDGKNLLLHFDGVNGSTTMTDSSAYGKTVTAYGGSAISTVTSKFGGSSLYFPGNAGNMVIANNSSDFAFGTGDFTVEFWMNPTAMSPGYSGYYNCMFDTRSSSNNGLFFFMNSSRNIRAYACGSFFMTSNATVSLNTWVNIAFTRRNGVFYLYVNGVLDNIVAASLNMTENKMNIGCNYEGASIPGIQFNGYIDEFRVTKGTALYAGGNYAVPNVPFALIS